MPPHAAKRLPDASLTEAVRAAAATPPAREAAATEGEVECFIHTLDGRTLRRSPGSTPSRPWG